MASRRGATLFPWLSSALIVTHTFSYPKVTPSFAGFGFKNG